MSYHTGSTSQLLWRGERLHLQHGPIDLIIGADEPHRATVFRAATERFSTLLNELVDELPLLRMANTQSVTGETAQLMVSAVRPFAATSFITPMAAVAGGVADTVLSAMRDAAPDAARLYVNNGGDIAVHLTGDATFKVAISDHENARMGTFVLRADDGIGGIATSGRHGRSLSMGIADSVTVLAKTAAQADAAATMIANAVDVPSHHAIERTEACVVDPASDLGQCLIVSGVAELDLDDIDLALNAGLHAAKTFQDEGLIKSAALFLRGEARATDHPMLPALLSQKLGSTAERHLHA